VANALLVAGAVVDAPDCAGLSPLHYAAASSDHGSSAESVGVLLAGGAAVDSADELGRTPLSHTAAEV
jgi:ankyrin repeat protein